MTNDADVVQVVDGPILWYACLPVHTCTEEDMDGIAIRLMVDLR